VPQSKEKSSRRPWNKREAHARIAPLIVRLMSAAPAPVGPAIAHFPRLRPASAHRKDMRQLLAATGKNLRRTRSSHCGPTLIRT
jgi:hypothetical protein